jgi:hypothetical protein
VQCNGLFVAFVAQQTMGNAWDCRWVIVIMPVLASIIAAAAGYSAAQAIRNDGSL